MTKSTFNLSTWRHVQIEFYEFNANMVYIKRSSLARAAQ